MFISTQSPCNVVYPLHQNYLAGLASVDWEGLLARSTHPNADIVDGETREQILQSLALRMRQVGYLRRLPAGKLRTKCRY